MIIRLVRKTIKTLKRCFRAMRNEDRWVDFNDGSWDLKPGQRYRYDLFGKAKLDGSKTFKFKGEAGHEIFEAIWEMVPPRDMYLPVVWGYKKDALVVRDLLQFHTLVAGATGEGKTSFLCTLIISLLHFSHPEYCKVAIFDPKGTELRCFKKACTVATSREEGEQLLLKVAEILRVRAGKVSADEPNFLTAKRRNKTAYSSRKKSMLAPYILVFADEYANLITWAKELGKSKGKEGEEERERGNRLLEAIHYIASMGRSHGIILILSTQSPYSEYIKGTVKANFTSRVSFHVNSHHANMLVLEKQRGGEADAIGLPTGHFLERQKKGRERYRAVYSDLNTVLSATKNWADAGLNWSI